jgi:ATPase subunit of ABC transporter with duplicated ATPase domains
MLYLIIGNYTAFEIAYNDKELNNRRVQEGIDKKRQQIEESIKRMQVVASKSDSAQGAVASRKKKLARCGAEKNEKGFRFRAQQDSYEGMSSIRAGSHNGERM